MIDNLEYISLENADGITVKYLRMVSSYSARKTKTISKKDIAALTSYYEKKLSPAISYLFSLGAKPPKELANIETIYPYFLVMHKARPAHIRDLISQFGQEEHFEVREKDFEIYRGNKLYIVNNLKEHSENIERFVHEQIFIREFKAQLHHYLNIHRTIWEKIETVIEKGEIRGK